MSSTRHILQRAAREQAEQDKLKALWNARAKAVLAGCHTKQRRMIQDPAKQKAGRCPRRSGKSHGAASYALYVGEMFPGSRVLIIGLTLKSAKENFWVNAPGGLQSLAGKYGISYDGMFNMADCSWKHENGSVGYLAGAETAADLERLRGSKVEVDLVIVDECKSFSPDLLHTLITDVLMPGLMTRDGTILLIGTPGSIPLGPFFEATEPKNRREEEGGAKFPTCILETERATWDALLSPEQMEDLWSLHTWTLQDNVAKPGQWARALREKRRNNWADDHPTWRREYLGEWVTLTLDLVYHQYLKGLADGRVTWEPNLRDGGVYGLPKEGGPWHYLIGLDWGYEDPTGFVVVAYGEFDPHMYVLETYKEEHLLYSEVKAVLDGYTRKYGVIDMIVYDRADKQLGESLAGDGYPAIPADKHEKWDYVELLNDDFASGNVKVQKKSDLHLELTGLQFDLSKGTKEKLAHIGRLKEHPDCPNHLCDALLYIWRWSYHQFGQIRPVTVDHGSPEWWKLQETKAREAAEAEFARNKVEITRLTRHGRVDHFLVNRFN